MAHVGSDQPLETGIGRGHVANREGKISFEKKLILNLTSGHRNLDLLGKIMILQILYSYITDISLGPIAREEILREFQSGVRLNLLWKFLKD
jgi:hypothetical protein